MDEDPPAHSGAFEYRLPLDGTDDIPRWLQAAADILDADGAVLVVTTLRCPDVRRVLHGTDRTAEQVADALYIVGSGPDLDAMADDAPRSIDIADPNEARRRPLLIDELIALDVDWVQAYPVGSGRAQMGTLQLHRRRAPTPQRRSYGCEVLVAKLARVLGVLLAHQVTSVGDTAPGGDVINMAIGILMARHTLTTDAASALLRAGAYARGHSSTTEADRVIDSVGHDRFR
jgi:hypothetical protein